VPPRGGLWISSLFSPLRLSGCCDGLQLHYGGAETNGVAAMTAAFAWGSWEDTWPNGQFAHVFKLAPIVDGWIEADGLYRAVDGETLVDLDTVDKEIAERALIVGQGGAVVRVHAEFAELLATLPVFLDSIWSLIPNDRRRLHPCLDEHCLPQCNRGLTRRPPSPVTSRTVLPG
jgi:hypothetical protein